MPATPAADPVPTRAAGLARLADFVPSMGTHYAARRNFDLGPGRHHGVSRLSPWIRRRLVSERETVAAALAAHGPDRAAKFIEEVVWRGYFKGWLEAHPAVWADYRAGLMADLARAEREPAMADRLGAAETGRTGLACFDAWARELVETGYLHNHARMWVASIWIFTLGLPWRIGADFFLRHLLDGDAASNTLGWRWVAGLHTRGKAYAARASNIARFTDGRFTPAAQDLGEAAPLEEPPPPPARAPRRPALPRAGAARVLLIHDEDCLGEGFGPDPASLLGVATLATGAGRSPRPVAPAVLRFDAGALGDARTRLAAAGAPAPVALDDPADLADWAAGHGAREVVAPFAPVGPVADALARAAPALAAAGIRLAEIRRDWDDAVRPHARAGFFRVRARIPRILADLGLTGWQSG